MRDAEGGGERSEPPVLPCGHYKGDRYYESSIKRLKIVITKEQGCHKDYRSDSEARSSPTRTHHSQLKFFKRHFLSF